MRMSINENEQPREECRLCGNFSVPKIRLSDNIKGFLSFKEFVEYFCRIELDDGTPENQLSSAACKDCYSMLLNFCIFTVKVENMQNKFKNRLPKHETPSVPTNVQNMDTSERKSDDSFSTISSSSESSKNSSKSSSKKSHKGNPPQSKRRRVENDDSEDEDKNNEKTENNQSTTIKQCLSKVNDLFKDEISTREKEYEKITIKETLLLKGGEIPMSWLERYQEFVSWKDFTYNCSHCNKQVKTLNTLLSHLNKVPAYKRSIKCTCCDKNFKGQSYLISYLNHVGKDMHAHLKFACIFCSKIFVNTVKLSQHMESHHGDESVKMYPCFDCGFKCGTMERLKSHKECHVD